MTRVGSARNTVSRPSSDMATNSAPDDYSREHMAHQDVIHRDKAVSKIGFQLVTLIPLALFGLAAVAGAILAIAAADAATKFGLGLASGLATVMTAGFAFLWSTLSVVRTVVTRDALQVHVGIWGPRIPIDKLEAIRLAPAPPFVRVGKRREGDRWVASYIVQRAEHVEIDYRDDEGRIQHLRFSADDPQGVIEAVNRARELRIESTDAPRADEKLAIEEAALAEAEAQSGSLHGRKS